MASVKVTFNDEMRRIKLQTPYSLEALLRDAASRFGLSQEHVNRATFRYSDADGDCITMKCDEELLDALVSSSPLRVQLIIEPAPRDQPRMDEPSIVSRQDVEIIALQDAGAMAAREELDQTRHEPESEERGGA